MKNYCLNLKDNEIRIIKQKKQSDFTILCNKCINDERLSIGGLALLVYIMSKPENWNVMISDIKRRFNIGRNKAYSIISELCAYGYMKRYREALSNGTVSKWVIVTSDNPILTNSQEDDKQPDPRFGEVAPDPRFGEVDKKVNQPIQDIENNNNISKSNENNPDPRFGEVTPYIQNKDFLINKENIYCTKKVFNEKFLEFWEHYDNKKGKEKCYKAYVKLLEKKGVGLHNDIMNSVEEQRRERESADNLGLWQPTKKLPLTWLSGHCWEDQVKTQEQLNEERQREIVKLSRKPQAMSKIDQYHHNLEQIGENARAQIIREKQQGARERGEEWEWDGTDSSLGFIDF